MKTKKVASAKDRTFLIITIPIVALFFLFNTLPLITGAFYSFTNYRGYGDFDFVGFRNYIDLFTDSRVGHSYLFTFKYAIAGTILINVLSLLLAMGLNSKIRCKSLLRTKYSDNTGGGSDTASYVTSTTDLLPLLSEFEYHGARTYANSAEKNYQAQYDYYKAGNSKVHYKHNATGTAAIAWCRSVYSSNASDFCRVGTGGSAGTSIAYGSWALAPCFFV